MNELDFSEIAKLNEKYNKDPRSRIFVQLADCYRKNNMIDEALDVLNKGLEYHPQYPLAYLVLGKCYFDKRAYIQARDAFEKTIAFDPNNIVALRMLAKTCEVLKDEKGQIIAYKNIIGIDPLDTNAKEKLTMLEALQRKEPLYTVAMAEEYEKQGDLDESLKIYENLLYTDPSDLMLKQKVAELKKTISEKKIKIEEEKIEEMQVESVFKATDLPGETITEPEKTLLSEQQKQPDLVSGAEEGIQSLEDFLVEELEQAAEKVAAKDSTAPPPGEEPTLPAQEMPAPEPAVSTEASKRVTREPMHDTAGPPAVEERQDDTDKAVEMSFGDIMLEKSTAPEKEPAIFEEEIEPPTAAEELPKTDETMESQTTAPAEPVLEKKDENPIQETAPGKAEEPEEKIEEPKKPKEEDFKSFQDWLSGLLK
jgi:tetratricopeptide (TPR) repeat protein